MGLTGSKRREEAASNSNDESGSESQSKGFQIKRSKPNDMLSKYAEIMKTKGILPDIFLVHEAKSSQYIDEDGDVANEFYQETRNNEGEGRRLCRLIKNLRPKEKERYAIPRLKPDVPVVIWEMQQSKE